MEIDLSTSNIKYSQLAMTCLQYATVIPLMQTALAFDFYAGLGFRKLLMPYLTNKEVVYKTY